MALPFLPRLLGFSRDRAGSGFLLGLTAVTAVVAALTDWTGGTRRMEAGEGLTDALKPGTRRGTGPVQPEAEALGERLEEATA